MGNFRQELIDSITDIKPYGDPESYKHSLEMIGDEIAGRRGRIAALNMYPLKGVQPMSIQEAQLTSTGLKTTDGKVGDRMAMVVRMKPGQHDEAGKYDGERMSLKDTPYLTRIHFGYDDKSGRLMMSAPVSNIEPLEFEPEEFEERSDTPVRVLYKGSNEIVTGTTLEGRVTERLREILAYFGEKVDDIGILVPDQSFVRPSDTCSPPQEGIETRYSDGAQLHVTNEETRQFLNNGLQVQYGHQMRGISMDAFRPNIVLKLPRNIEDLAYGLSIKTSDGDASIRLAGLTPRCKVPLRDTENGELGRDGEPNKWLAQHRPKRPWDRHMTFGANADTNPSSHGAVISVDDSVVIESEKVMWREEPKM